MTYTYRATCTATSAEGRDTVLHLWYDSFAEALADLPRLHTQAWDQITLVAGPTPQLSPTRRALALGTMRSPHA